MVPARLHSIMLEFQVRDEVVISFSCGRQIHALFLTLMKQCDQDLFFQLHGEKNPRPFTLSPLLGGQKQGDMLFLRKGSFCSIRLTFLDGGFLWSRLRAHVLKSAPIPVRLETTSLWLTRIYATPSVHAPTWAGSTTWETLLDLPPKRLMTFHFLSPTAFALGKRHFELFPKPLRLWDSLLRAWNEYAPEEFQLNKQQIRQFVSEQTMVMQCELHTETLYFQDHIQRGFTGTCTYRIYGDDALVAQLTTLVAFAFYSGVGSKTTMGMGQVRTEFHESCERSSLSLTR